jgi:protocatechuate 3,4-dioxygenase beta subunit
MGGCTFAGSRLWKLLGITAISAVAVLWPCTALAQDEDELDDDLPPPRMVRVHGTVWEVDGSPAAGRLVRFAPQNWGSPEARTHSDGSYSMEMNLRRPQWVKAWVDGVARSRFLRIAAPEGATEVELDIQLVPPIVMSGTVALPDGRPAANMVLKAEGYATWSTCGVAGWRGGTSRFDLRTDGQGGYSVVLPGGDLTRYQLYISQEGVGSIGPVEIETDVDCPDVRRDLHLTEGGTIEGVVIAAADRSPLAGAYVSFATGHGLRGHAFGRRVETNEEGKFRFAPLPPGGYQLSVDFDEDWEEGSWVGVDEGLWAVLNAEPEWGTVGLAEGETAEVEFRMVKELVVTGRVLGPDGAPLPHAMLEDMKVETDGEGCFVYRIRPRHGPYGKAYLESDISLAPRVQGVGIAVPVRVTFLDAAPQEVEIHIVEPGAVTGRVVYEGTGRPVPGGHVCICPIQPKGPQHPLDDSGRFEVRDMLPGQYNIDAGGPTTGKCVPGPATVTVRSGETVGPIEIEIEQKPSIGGRILGLPAEKERELPHGGWSSFRLECIFAPAGRPERAAHADLDWQPDGSFTAWLLVPPGRYDVVLRGGYSDLKLVSNVIRSVEITESGGATDLEFALSPGVTISGRVLAADGVTPLPSIAVLARPISGDALLLIPQPMSKHEQPAPPGTDTDGDGYFSIGALLPGEYEVAAEWQRDCFGGAHAILVRLAEGEQRNDLEFRAAEDWP